MISANTSIFDCAVNIGSDLKEWATVKRYGFAFARDPLRTFDLLASAPDGATLVLSFDGRNPDSDNIYSQNRRVVFTANLIVNEGLDISPEHDYTRSPSESACLLERVAELEERIFTFSPPGIVAGRNSEMDRVKDEGTTGIVLPSGQPLRGYAVKFSFLVKSPSYTLRN